MNFLLDTCVLSDLVSKRPNPDIARWIDSVDPDRIRALVAQATELPSLGLPGEPRVNVLQLNLALDAALASGAG